MMYYCIADGYEHQRSSRVGRQHEGLRVKQDEFDPFDVAVGVSISLGNEHTRYRANKEQIRGFWDVEDFDRQFDRDPIERIREWVRISLVGRDRYHGHEWYEFLANERATRNQPMSPKRFSLLMRRYANEYDRIEGPIW